MNGSYDAGSGIYRITLIESFDFGSHQDFRAKIKEAVDNKSNQLVLDFAPVDYMDSAALGMLMLARSEMEKISGTVTLDNVHGYVEKVLTMVKFDDLFTVNKKASS